MKEKSFVLIKFPKTGLGNMLFIWAKGFVFAKLNQLELIVNPWWGFRWGALLRREQRKRLYWRYFTESPFSKQVKAFIALQTKKVIIEPVVKELCKAEETNENVYLFNEVMTNPDLFNLLEDYQQELKQALFDLLHPLQKKKLQQFKSPVIGIHVRRGDFKMGSTITPVDFFVKGINIIRRYTGEELPVTIFTDASPEEIKELLALTSVSIAEKKSDILDILLLSRSRILFLSASSTFSYWAAFLSNAFTVRPENDWLVKIKNNTNSSNGFFDFRWQHKMGDSEALLVEAFKDRQLLKTKLL